MYTKMSIKECTLNIILLNIGECRAYVNKKHKWKGLFATQMLSTNSMSAHLELLHQTSNFIHVQTLLDNEQWPHYHVDW